MRDNLEVREVEVENGSEKGRFIVVRNPKQVEEDKAGEKTLSMLETDLTAGDAKVVALKKGYARRSLPSGA